MSNDCREKKRLPISLDSELYRRAKALGLNVSGVSERALREYVDRLENGSGQSGVLVGTNGPDRSNDTSDNAVDDTDANNDTEAKYQLLVIRFLYSVCGVNFSWPIHRHSGVCSRS